MQTYDHRHTAYVEFKLTYNPSLDGLRAISALLVVALHCKIPFIPGGMVGVNIFFVLSGFLITSLLRAELTNTGTIALRTFYYHRLLRLWPPLLLFLTAYYLFLGPFFPGTNVTADVLVAGSYLSDYTMAIWRSPRMLSHTWSLSVEEHFYLLWPIVVLMTRRIGDQRLFRYLIVAFVVSTAWRIFDALWWADWFWTYYRFDTRVSGLILGSALSVLRWKPDARDAVKIGNYSIVVLAVAAVTFRLTSMEALTFGGILVDIAAVGLIASIAAKHETYVTQFLSQPALVYLGKLSYSIYLWHFPFALWFRDSAGPWMAFIAVISISIALSAISYRYLEGPIRSVRHRHFASKKLSTLANSQVAL